MLQQKAESATDPLQKQELTLKCRIEQRTLTTAANNVGEVSKKLDIVVDFLTDMKSQLTVIDGKLTALQEDVTAIREDLRRLTGKPVLEMYKEWAEATIQQDSASLQSSVYIEAKVCKPGPREDFTPGPDNPEKGIETSFKEFFNHPKKQLLLLTGQAGSGKSTAVEKLVNFVLTEYRKRSIESGEATEVVLLPVNLPSIRDPINGIFDQGSAMAFGGALRQSQIDELRTLVQNKEGKIRFILLLDAYDELSQDNMKNLYRSNNLNNLMCTR